MVKDHSDSEKGNPLPPYRLLLSINSKGSFICTIPPYSNSAFKLVKVMNGRVCHSSGVIPPGTLACVGDSHAGSVDR